MEQKRRIGDRLKEARIGVGLTQKEAAEKAGFRHFQTLAKIEGGHRSVKAVELARLADVYARDVGFFFSDAKPKYDFNISWRKCDEDIKLSEYEQKLKTLLERYLSLEDRLGLREAQYIFPKIEQESLSYEYASELGEQFARWLGLGMRPAISLSEILEKEKSIPIFYLQLAKGASACTISSNEVSAICINSWEAPWRRNYNLAHEFFHILYPTDQEQSCDSNSTSNIDKWANAFASGLLLPVEEIQKFVSRYREAGAIPILEIALEANDFCVSTQALIWRLVNLDWIERGVAEELIQSEYLKEKDREIRSVISWRTPHISHRFVAMIFKAVAKGILSNSKAANYMMINLAELNTVFREEGFNPDEDYSEKVSLSTT